MRPNPEYAPVEFDDDAFLEYLAEYGESPNEDGGEQDISDDAPLLDPLVEYGFLPEEGDDDLSS